MKRVVIGIMTVVFLLSMSTLLYAAEKNPLAKKVADMNKRMKLQGNAPAAAEAAEEVKGKTNLTEIKDSLKELMEIVNNLIIKDSVSDDKEKAMECFKMCIEKIDNVNDKEAQEFLKDIKGKIEDLLSVTERASDVKEIRDVNEKLAEIYKEIDTKGIKEEKINSPKSIEAPKQPVKQTTVPSKKGFKNPTKQTPGDK